MLLQCIMPLYKCNLETIWSLLHLHSGLNLTFLTAILHRGLRNCFFTHSFTFHILFGLLYPLSIWTFISLFYLNFFQFNFSSIPFQFQFNFISISVQFQLKFSSISVQVQFFFNSFFILSRSQIGFLPNTLIFPDSFHAKKCTYILENCTGQGS